MSSLTVKYSISYSLNLSWESGKGDKSANDFQPISVQVIYGSHSFGMVCAELCVLLNIFNVIIGCMNLFCVLCI